MHPRIAIAQDKSLRDGEECAFRGKANMLNIGEGEIFVTNSRILFVPSASSPIETIELDYKSIALHAISSTEYGKKYIFIQLAADDDPAEGWDETVSAEVQSSNDGVNDIIEIYPADESSIESLFKAMNDMSALHPDDDIDDDDDQFEEQSDVEGA